MNEARRDEVPRPCPVKAIIGAGVPHMPSNRQEGLTISMNLPILFPFLSHFFGPLGACSGASYSSAPDKLPSPDLAQGG